MSLKFTKYTKRNASFFEIDLINDILSYAKFVEFDSIFSFGDTKHVGFFSTKQHILWLVSSKTSETQMDIPSSNFMRDARGAQLLKLLGKANSLVLHSIDRYCCMDNESFIVSSGSLIRLFTIDEETGSFACVAEHDLKQRVKHIEYRKNIHVWCGGEQNLQLLTLDIASGTIHFTSEVFDSKNTKFVTCGQLIFAGVEESVPLFLKNGDTLVTDIGVVLDLSAEFEQFYKEKCEDLHTINGYLYSLTHIFSLHDGKSFIIPPGMLTKNIVTVITLQKKLLLVTSKSIYIYDNDGKNQEHVSEWRSSIGTVLHFDFNQRFCLTTSGFYSVHIEASTIDEFTEPCSPFLKQLFTPMTLHQDKLSFSNTSSFIPKSRRNSTSIQSGITDFEEADFVIFDRVMRHDQKLIFESFTHNTGLNAFAYKEQAIFPYIKGMESNVVEVASSIDWFKLENFLPIRKNFLFEPFCRALFVKDPLALLGLLVVLNETIANSLLSDQLSFNIFELCVLTFNHTSDGLITDDHTRVKASILYLGNEKRESVRVLLMNGLYDDVCLLLQSVGGAARNTLAVFVLHCIIGVFSEIQDPLDVFIGLISKMLNFGIYLSPTTVGNIILSTSQDAEVGKVFESAMTEEFFSAFSKLIEKQSKTVDTAVDLLAKDLINKI
ncbi:hypothetical protein PCE1_001827 [Barthelona sp. PCE]